MTDPRNDSTETEPDVPDRIGPYEVGGPLGKGGMGEVYRGYDDRLARHVALKRVVTDTDRQDRFRRRLRREARTVAQLSHPSIVQVYDWVETEDYDWLVMELIDGRSLSELARDSELSVPRIVGIAIRIAEGLAAAHEAGIVHRDLKLSNVMVAKSGVKILDFGIAKPMQTTEIAQTDITREGAVVGTAASMSPEQAQGLPIDHRSDLFSFGTLLYELLSGSDSPFRGRDLMQTMIRIYSLQQVPVVELNTDVPLRLSALVDHLLAKDPDRRPATAEIVAEELRQIAAELRGEQTASASQPLFSTESLEATVAGGAPSPSSAGTSGPSGSLSAAGPSATGVPATSMSTTRGAPPGIPAGSDTRDTFTGTGVGTGTLFDPAANTVRSWIGIAAVTLLAALVGWGVYLLQESRNTTPVPAAEDAASAPGKELRPDRIVVLPFENRTGDEEFDSLGLVISDWLTQGLSLSRQLEVVPTNLAVRAVQFAEAEAGSDNAPRDLELVAEDTGAQTIVDGAYYLQKGELILRGKITDAGLGQVITGLEQVRTPSDDPIGFLDEFEQSVRASVAAYLDPQLTTYGNLFNLPPTYEAYEAYVRGMESFWKLDFPGAIESYEVAAELAPEFAMPRLMAATSYLNMAQYENVSSVIKALDEELGELAPIDRFWLDWLRAEVDGDHVRAAQVAGRVASLAPLSGWPQTRGVASLRANMPHQALEVLGPLDPESGYLRGWFPHFEYLTLAYHLTGDHEGELEAARHGREIYPASILCLYGEARALVALGRTQEALDLLEAGQALPQQYVHSPGLVILLIATEFSNHGLPEAESAAYEMLFAWYQSLEQKEALPSPEKYLWALGALASERPALALDIALSLLEEDAESIENIGLVGVAAASAGRLDLSNAQLEKLRKVDQSFLFGRNFYWLAAVHAWQGSDDEATRLFQKAVAEGHPFAWPRLHPHFDPIWRPLRGSPEFADVIRPRG